MVTQCDLATVSFDAAMGTLYVPIYLHVNPALRERAERIAAERRSYEARGPIIVVDDDTLNINEWYLVSAIGSNPP